MYICNLTYVAVIFPSCICSLVAACYYSDWVLTVGRHCYITKFVTERMGFLCKGNERAVTVQSVPILFQVHCVLSQLSQRYCLAICWRDNRDCRFATAGAVKMKIYLFSGCQEERPEPLSWGETQIPVYEGECELWNEGHYFDF